VRAVGGHPFIKRREKISPRGIGKPEKPKTEEKKISTRKEVLLRSWIDKYPQMAKKVYSFLL